MVRYAIAFLPGAKEFIVKADKSLRKQLGYALYQLQENPRREGVKKLKGKVNKRDAYRYRVGDYRIVYHIKDQFILIEVVKIGHRRDIYQ